MICASALCTNEVVPRSHPGGQPKRYCCSPCQIDAQSARKMERYYTDPAFREDYIKKVREYQAGSGFYTIWKRQIRQSLERNLQRREEH